MSKNRPKILADHTSTGAPLPTIQGKNPIPKEQNFAPDKSGSKARSDLKTNSGNAKAFNVVGDRYVGQTRKPVNTDF